MNRMPFILFFVALLILAVFGILGREVLRHAPAKKTVCLVSVQPSAGGVVLGRSELGQRSGPFSGEKEHLRVQHDGGAWSFSSLARTRKVDVRTSRVNTLFLKRWNLAPGDTVMLGGKRLSVEEAGEGSLRIKEQDGDTGREVQWHNGSLVFHPSEAFSEELLYEGGIKFLSGFRRKIKWHLRNILADREIPLFHLGGEVNCRDQWRLKGIPCDAARVVWFQKGFWLAPGSVSLPVELSRRGEEPKSFSELVFPLESERWGTVQRMIVGRTRYLVKPTSLQLELTPASAMDVFPQDQEFGEKMGESVRRDFRNLEWTGAGTPVSQWIGNRLRWVGAALVLGLAATVVVVTLRSRSKMARSKTASLILVPCLTVIPATFMVVFCPLLFFSVDADLWLLLALAWGGWLWSSVLLGLGSRLRGLAGILWLLALTMAGIGAILLTQLAAGAENTQWAGFARRHLSLLAIFGWAGALLVLLPTYGLSRMWENAVCGTAWFWRWVRLLVPIAGVLLLLAQLLIGSEEGLGGFFQPAEVAKLLLAVMAGFVGMHLTEIRSGHAQSFRKNRLLFVLSYLKEIVLVGIACLLVLVGVNDMSPILIIAILVLALAWRVAPHPIERPWVKWIIRGCVGFLLSLFVALSCWTFSSPESLPQWFPQRERLLVWANPAQFPHSGRQVSQAMSMAGQGGWFGCQDRWFGPNGMANAIPMVQNDFILTFLFYKFGAVAGQILAAIQLGYLYALFSLSRRLREWSESIQMYRSRQAGNVWSYVIYGLAWIHVSQWAISWGNALGLLPVMGQPMTWISAANSHLLVIGFPTLVLGLVSSWTIQSAAGEGEP